MKVELPLPPKELSPNVQVHWGTRRRAVDKYRSDCCLKALSDLREGQAEIRSPLPWVEAVSFHFRLPDKRRRDLDNLLASIKHGVDGALVDSGLLEDDSLWNIRQIIITAEVVAGPGSVVIMVTP